MGLNADASAALTFLILYIILFLVLFVGYSTGRVQWRSHYTIIFVHIAFRLASQCSGLAFGIVGNPSSPLSTAYFVLGAEGYLTLVMCTYRFLISWQIDNSDSHESWLEPKQPPDTPTFKKILNSFALFGPRRSPMSIIHNALIVGNSLIITGGSMVAGARNSYEQLYSSLVAEKGLRVAGQTMFLLIHVFLLYSICRVIRECRCERNYIHPTLLVLLATWPLLLVRGVYGVLSALIPSFNYFHFANYVHGGLKDDFVISEYTLSTTMEWMSCLLLMLTWVTSRNDPKKADLDELEMENGKKIIICD